MNLTDARKALDKVIDKARVHLYKPIQIAEILYRDRVKNDLVLEDLETYRTSSRKWRDVICNKFLGRSSTSSARYQDDVFNDNAVPPIALKILATENKKKNGIVEKYIYERFGSRFNQLNSSVLYCESHDKHSFDLTEFISLFWSEPGLRRSIDKVYEIVVYSLFSTLVDSLEVTVELRLNPAKIDLFTEFKDFADTVLSISDPESKLILPAKIHRVGVTNASDRGLDMWANFGLAIQIKHLSLTEELAEDIVSSISADRIVIVCKDSEKNTIVSLLTQIGWKSKIQSIVTESTLINWYNRALTGKYAHILGDKVINAIKQEISSEFPATNNVEFVSFMNSRGYDTLPMDTFWQYKP